MKCYVELFLFLTVIVVATCLHFHAYDDEIAWESMTEDERMKDDNSNADGTTSDKFKFKVPKATNVFCTLANMKIVIDIPKNKFSSTVPSEAIPSGTCNDMISQMHLKWEENEITFTFINDYTSFSVLSIDLNITLVKDKLKLVGSSGNVLRWFPASVKNGLHSCTKPKTLDIGEMKVTISEVSLIAFNTEQDISKRTEEKCNDSNDVETFPYKLVTKEGDICTLAKWSMVFDIPYKTKNSEAKAKVEVPVNPKEMTVTGTCDTLLSLMKITWPATTALNNSVTIAFEKNDKNTFVSSILAKIYIEEKKFPNATELNKPVNVVANNEMFHASAENGIYSCETGTKHESDGSVLTISDVILVAFDAKEKFASKKESTCSSQGTTLPPTIPPTTKPEGGKTTNSKTQPTIHPTDPHSETTLVPPVKPDPSVPKFNYIVTNSQTNISCILANMIIQMTINYKTTDSKEEKKTVVVPKTAETQGTCENTTATMRLIWSPEVPKYESLKNTVSFLFQRDTSTFYVKSLSVDINLDEKTFPNAKEKKCNGTTTELHIFSASMKHMYKCEPGTLLDANDIQVKIDNVTLIAFNTDVNVTSNAAFLPVENCENPAESEANVGAIVGGIIGGLFLLAIFVYAYISWRRGRLFLS